jgi:hypothetical protein
VELLHAKLKRVLKVGGVSDSLIQHVKSIWYTSPTPIPRCTRLHKVCIPNNVFRPDKDGISAPG